MTPAALPPAPPAPFGVVYSVPALVVFFILVIALLVLPAVADRTAAKVAQWIWLAAVLDVIFELALVAIAAVVGLGSGIEGLWAGAGRRDFVLDASLYVPVRPCTSW
jgi:hypothetical protein